MSQPPEPQYSADGRLFWDGERWQPVPQAIDEVAPSRISGGLVLAGALAVLVGTFLPWLEASAPFVGSISRDLISGLDGQVLAFVAALAAAIGLYLLVRGPGIVAGIVALLATIIAGGITIVDYQDVSRRVASATSGDTPILASIGPGPYLSAIGVLVLALGGLTAIYSALSRKTEDREEPT